MSTSMHRFSKYALLGVALLIACLVSGSVRAQEWDEPDIVLHRLVLAAHLRRPIDLGRALEAK